MKFRHVFFVLFLFVLLPNINVTPAQAAIAATGNEFTLYYSNDVHGETVPCG
jgi:hypothetical protein